MVIISKSILDRFGTTHPSAVGTLDEWFHTVKKADWRNLAEVKNTLTLLTT